MQQAFVAEHCVEFAELAECVGLSNPLFPTLSLVSEPRSACLALFAQARNISLSAQLSSLCLRVCADSSNLCQQGTQRFTEILFRCWTVTSRCISALMPSLFVAASALLRLAALPGFPAVPGCQRGGLPCRVGLRSGSANAALRCLESILLLNFAKTARKLPAKEEGHAEWKPFKALLDKTARIPAVPNRDGRCDREMHAEAIVSGGCRGAFNKKPVIGANISVFLQDYYAFAKMMQIQAPRELALYPHALVLWPERHQLLEEGFAVIAVDCLPRGEHRVRFLCALATHFFFHKARWTGSVFDPNEWL